MTKVEEVDLASCPPGTSIIAAFLGGSITWRAFRAVDTYGRPLVLEQGSDGESEVTVAVITDLDAYTASPQPHASQLTVLRVGKTISRVLQDLPGLTGRHVLTGITVEAPTESDPPMPAR